MAKLTDILSEVNSEKSFSTKQKETDPTTGAVTWDVSYGIELDTLYKDVDKVVNNIVHLVNKNRGDQRLIELYKSARNLRNRLSRYMKLPA